MRSFEHITHHQCNEKRHGEIPVGLLEGKKETTVAKTMLSPAANMKNTC